MTLDSVLAAGSPTFLRSGCVEMPSAGNALQLVLASIVELEPRTGDEILHRARHEDLVGLGERGDTLADVHRHASDVVAAKLELARVQSHTDVDPEAAGRSDNGVPAPDRARWSVERRQNPVAGRLHLTAAEHRELLSHGFVVRVQHCLPVLIP